MTEASGGSFREHATELTQELRTPLARLRGSAALLHEWLGKARERVNIEDRAEGLNAGAIHRTLRTYVEVGWWIDELRSLPAWPWAFRELDAYYGFTSASIVIKECGPLSDVQVSNVRDQMKLADDEHFVDRLLATEEGQRLIERWQEWLTAPTYQDPRSLRHPDSGNPELVIEAAAALEAALSEALE